MNIITEKIQKLINELDKLPEIGPKMAERLTYHILETDNNEINALLNAIIDLKSTIKFCKICFAPSDKDICNICSDETRDHSIICVVEKIEDMLAIEKTKKLNCVYHNLSGCISPLDGIGPENLHIKELLKRIDKNIKEIIIATNATTEGDITANYIKDLLKKTGIKITRIGYGLPMGGELEYADDITILRALESRKEI